MMQNKADLRRHLIAARSAIGEGERAQWNAVIGDHVLAWCAANDIRSLGVYWPIRGEPDLRPAYGELSARGVQLALPTVETHDAALRFARWQPGDAMVKDRFGVAVPADAGDAVQPDALLIPCVGFNREHYRLGYGGGFYDRTLALLPRPRTAGIAYANAAADFVGEPHDVALDIVITERWTG